MHICVLIEDTALHVGQFRLPWKKWTGWICAYIKTNKKDRGFIFFRESLESDFRVFCFFNKRVHGLQMHSSQISDGKLQVHSFYNSVSSQILDLPHQLIRQAMISRFEYGLLSRNKNCEQLIWAGCVIRGRGIAFSCVVSCTWK